MTDHKFKYSDMSDDEIRDRLKHLAAQWFSNEEILLLEELFRRFVNAENTSKP
jgi:hypothetical protein